MKLQSECPVWAGRQLPLRTTVRDVAWSALDGVAPHGTEGQRAPATAATRQTRSEACALALVLLVCPQSCECDLNGGRHRRLLHRRSVLRKRQDVLQVDTGDVEDHALAPPVVHYATGLAGIC